MKAIRLRNFSYLILIFSLLAHASNVKNDIAAAMRAQVSPGLKYRSISTLTSEGKTQKIIAEVIFPDRFHLQLPEMECIIVPQGTWMKRRGAGWTKLPMDMNALIKQYTPEAIEEAVKGIGDVQYLGEEQVHGGSAKSYSYNFNSAVMGINSKGSTKVWISENGRVVHSEVNVNAAGRNSKVVQDIEYDDGIQIAAPQ